MHVYKAQQGPTVKVRVWRITTKNRRLSMVNERPKGSDFFVLKLLYGFGLHPFSRVLQPRKIEDGCALLQPAGNAALESARDSKDATKQKGPSA